MAQFPLALAIEPRLLPYAVANGFQMDSKVFLELFPYVITWLNVDSIAILFFEKCSKGLQLRPSPVLMILHITSENCVD